MIIKNGKRNHDEVIVKLVGRESWMNAVIMSVVA